MKYHVTKGFRVFAYILGSLFILGGLAPILFSFNASIPTEKWAMIITGLFILAIGLMFIVGVVRTSLNITDRSVINKDIFTTREFLFEEIAGYRITNRNVLTIVAHNKRRPMRISAYLERGNDIRAWLKTNYRDLDMVQHEQETKEIIANQEFGADSQQRYAMLDKARKYCRAATFASVVLLLWILISPTPYEWVMTALLVAPWIGVYAVNYFKGLIRLGRRKGSAYPSITMLMALPTFGVLLANIRDYKIYLFDSQAWSILLGTTAIVSAISFFGFAKAIAAGGKKILSAICVIVMAGVYSWGLIIFSNCFYDSSIPDRYETRLEGKHYTSGKTTTYYLDLEPWGRFEKVTNETVPKDFYNMMEAGDTVYVYLRKGKWNIPWYWIAKH